MRKLLDIKIEDDGRVTFQSEYQPLKGMNLFQLVFVSLMFEPDKLALAKLLNVIRILGLADVCASKRPEVSMSMFERTMDDLAGLARELKRHMGGNLNFALS